MMKSKRILRSWWLWAALILVGFLVVPSLLSGGSPYHKVSTSDAIAQINAGNVTKALQKDKEQTLELTLKKDFKGHSKITTQYPSDASSTIFNDLTKAAATPNNSIAFDTKVSKQNTWVSLLVSLLPILLIVGVLFFVMSQVQGGGNRVMSFGRSKAK
ncbi:MAG: ATP-dependent metallopeptidase FtsH/Yme1/Tma family protein, partial [Pseudonocardiales bacterium]